MIHVAPHLLQEIDAVIYGAMADERQPLPRQPRPLFDVPDSEDEKTADLIGAELSDGHVLTLGNIAARVLRTETQVERALLVARLAGQVELVSEATRIGNMPDRATSQWRAVLQ